MFQLSSAGFFVCLIDSFNNQQRSLIRSANMQEEGLIKIKITSGAHLTSDCVMEALEMREKQQRGEALKRKQIEEIPEAWRDFNEPPSAMRCCAKLADARHEQRKRLRKSKAVRRVHRRIQLVPGRSIPEQTSTV